MPRAIQAALVAGLLAACSASDVSVGEAAPQAPQPSAEPPAGDTPAGDTPAGDTPAGDTPPAPNAGLVGIVAEKREALSPEPVAESAPLPSAVELASGTGAAWKPTESELKSPPSSARITKSGLRYHVLRSGAGSRRPGEHDKVEVHYTGWTTDGKQFDSSKDRGRSSTFPLDKVIVGWTEGLQLMVEGEVTRFWIPEDLAYLGKPGKPAGMLIFDVELISIETMPVPPKAPADVAAPPASATRTASGLAYEVLTPGGGVLYPKETDRVVVHYTGWTTDGKRFDSSVSRGRSAKFKLTSVIPGWTEGLQLMSVGETAVLWIPEDLAYKGRPGKPAGMLVFQVELLSIE